MINLDFSFKSIIFKLLCLLTSILIFKITFRFLDYVILENTFPFDNKELLFFIVDCIVLYLLFASSFIIAFLAFKIIKFDIKSKGMIKAFHDGLFESLIVVLIIGILGVFFVTIVLSGVVNIFTAFFFSIMLIFSTITPSFLGGFLFYSFIKGIKEELNSV